MENLPNSQQLKKLKNTHAISKQGTIVKMRPFEIDAQSWAAIKTHFESKGLGLLTAKEVCTIILREYPRLASMEDELYQQHHLRYAGRDEKMIKYMVAHDCLTWLYMHSRTNTPQEQLLSIALDNLNKSQLRYEEKKNASMQNL